MQHQMHMDLAPFMPHGHCYLWTPGILWSEVFANLAISLAYLAIPVILFVFLKGRRDIPYPHVIIMFALFITSCGIGHLIDVITIWYPIYWVKAFWDVITGTVSVATVLVVAPLLPRLMKVGSITELVQAETIAQLERQQGELEAARAMSERSNHNLHDQMKALREATALLAERERLLVEARSELERYKGQGGGHGGA